MQTRSRKNITMSKNEENIVLPNSESDKDYIPESGDSSSDGDDDSFIVDDDSDDDMEEYEDGDDTEGSEDSDAGEDTEGSDEDEDDDDDKPKARRTIVPLQILNALRHRGASSRFMIISNDDDDDDDLPVMKKRKRKDTEEEAAMRKFVRKYSEEEQKYLRSLSHEQLEKIKEFEKTMEVMNNIPEVPLRFKVLTSTMELGSKRLILQRLDQFQKMHDGAGEYYKLSNWLQSVCRLPLGMYNPLPVTHQDSRAQISTFLQTTKTQLDTIVYGHSDAKNQLLRILAQWISNPSSKGHCIGIHGPPGIGKTSLIKNGISKALNLPFAFVPLGGASDSSFLDGHSFTYEGSMYGKVAEVLMRTQCMNPVIFFDELDKVSETNKGDEISHILTHLTDSTQNDKFYDKYFGELDLDLSKALMVFSYNHEEKIDPILRDRMISIKVKGYDTEDKLQIARNFLIPSILQQYGFKDEDIVFSEHILKSIIQRVSEEHGVRNFKRGIESIASWVNMYQYVPPPDMNAIEFPYTVSEECVKKMIIDTNKSAMTNAMYM